MNTGKRPALLGQRAQPSEPDFKALFESSPDLNLVLTPDLRIVAVSDAYLRATAAKREQILGRDVFRVFPDNPDEIEAHRTRNLRESLQRVIDTRAPDVMSVQKYNMRRPDFEGGGFEARYWSPINTPVIGTNGELCYIVHSVRDVTGFIQEGHELEKITELEFRVHERTKQLQDTIRELESFSYSVSHDLKAPLRAIDGFSRILIEEFSDKLDADGRHVLNVIRTSTLKMGNLIESLLDLARLGRKQMQLVDVDMKALVRNVFHEVRSAAPERNVELRCGPLHHVKADPVLMQQVLMNLLSNAFKFTRHREQATVEVGSELRESSREVVFWIRDNGVGFEMQYVDKLFGVFQRLHTDREFDGTGIGLAIVQRAVHRHAGRVWAESILGEGATFFFSIPAIRTSAY